MASQRIERISLSIGIAALALTAWQVVRLVPKKAEMATYHWWDWAFLVVCAALFLVALVVFLSAFIRRHRREGATTPLSGKLLPDLIQAGNRILAAAHDFLEPCLDHSVPNSFHQVLRRIGGGRTWYDEMDRYRADLEQRYANSALAFRRADSDREMDTALSELRQCSLKLAQVIINRRAEWVTGPEEEGPTWLMGKCRAFHDATASTATWLQARAQESPYYRPA